MTSNRYLESTVPSSSAHVVGVSITRIQSSLENYEEMPSREQKQAEQSGGALAAIEGGESPVVVQLEESDQLQTCDEQASSPRSHLSALDEAIVILPTSTSTSVQRQQVPTVDGSENGLMVVRAVAHWVSDLEVIDLEAAGGAGRLAANTSDFISLRTFNTSNMAAFVSVTIRIPRLKSSLGLEVACLPRELRDIEQGSTAVGSSCPRGCLQILAIDSKGPLAQSPFRVGYVLVSINGQSCQGISLDQFRRMERGLHGTVTLIGHNHGKYPGDGIQNMNNIFVETMVEKPEPNCKVGIHLKTSGIVGDPIRIERIGENGLAAHSLMNVGDRVLAINSVPTSTVDVREARELIAKAPRWVTIVTESAGRTALVLGSSAPTMKTARSWKQRSSCSHANSNGCSDVPVLPAFAVSPNGNIQESLPSQDEALECRLLSYAVLLITGLAVAAVLLR